MTLALPQPTPTMHLPHAWRRFAFLVVAVCTVCSLSAQVGFDLSDSVAAAPALALTPPLQHLNDFLDSQVDGALNMTDGVVTLSNDYGVATLGLPANADNIEVTPLHGNGVRFLAQLDSADDPTSYTFPLTLPAGVTFYETPDHGVAVRAPHALDTDPPLAWIGEPFVVDATGRHLPVTQTVNEHEITLTIDHTDAVYPVLADPTFYDILCASFDNHASTLLFTTWTQQCPYGFTFIMANGYWPVSARIDGRGEWWNVRASGECTIIPDMGGGGDYWNWQVPCYMHDYCYDLLRVYPPFNYPGVHTNECDYLLELAAGSECSTHWLFISWWCQDILEGTVMPAIRRFGGAGWERPAGGWFW